jgi:hypothetical protein
VFNERRAVTVCLPRASNTQQQKQHQAPYPAPSIALSLNITEKRRRDIQSSSEELNDRPKIGKFAEV